MNGPDLTDHDPSSLRYDAASAARLAEIRLRDRVRDGEIPHNVHCANDRRDLLRLLDAAARPHDASFVTRDTYNAALGNVAATIGCPFKDATSVAIAGAALKRRAEAAEASAANLAAAVAASEAKLCEAQRVLEPFVAEFERRREAYLRRGERQIMEGNFDRMPDHWPVSKFNITMGQCRTARAALAADMQAIGGKS
jgi:hypothetical protein